MRTSSDRKESTSRKASPRELALREARTSDGIAMWRLARGRVSAEGLSPFFYMVLIEHFGDSCLIAERDGEIVGYVIATKPGESAVLRLLDLCLRPPHDSREEIFELLGALVALPQYRSAEVIEPTASCDPGVRSALRDLLGLSLARCDAPRGSQSAAAG